MRPREESVKSISSQFLSYCQVQTRPMTCFSFADQDVVVCVAFEDKDCDADAGTGHDDSWLDQIFEKNGLVAYAEI